AREAGTPPSRHYDLGARSSLHGSGRQMPAVVGRRAPKETEARPREPKTATVERREASVPRHGTQGASQAPGVPRHVHAPRVPRTHPNVSRRSAHPSFRVSEATMQTPGAKNAPRERRGVVRCQIFQLVVPAEPRQRREPESIITGGGYGFRVREHAAKLAQAA